MGKECSTHAGGVKFIKGLAEKPQGKFLYKYVKIPDSLY
jgi:hypothetical protein